MAYSTEFVHFAAIKNWSDQLAILWTKPHLPTNIFLMLAFAGVGLPLHNNKVNGDVSMNINDNNDKHCDSDANPPRRSFLKKMAVGAALAGALTLG
ncbi:MAG: hypothetical protein KAG70_01715, partial [Alcanivorax sp.]|nr:hypothetical protein [Alcanivorax sp.]